LSRSEEEKGRERGSSDRLRVTESEDAPWHQCAHGEKGKTFKCLTFSREWRGGEETHWSSEEAKVEVGERTSAELKEKGRVLTSQGGKKKKILIVMGKPNMWQKVATKFIQEEKRKGSFSSRLQGGGVLAL